ncbi:hypothetical protein D3C73_1633720 [compost metagenome]
MDGPVSLIALQLRQSRSGVRLAANPGCAAPGGGQDKLNAGIDKDVIGDDEPLQPELCAMLGG